MMMEITVGQGDTIALLADEVGPIQDILKKRGMSWDCLDARQQILKLPQRYVGYIGLPNRKIVIRPKHEGLTIGHILRVYYFLYLAEFSDLDVPIYDVELGDNINIIDVYIHELLAVIHKGLPVEYETREENLNFARGGLRIVPTAMNIRLKKKDAFCCVFDDLVRDIKINRLLLAAVKKIESFVDGAKLAYIMRQFGDVDYSSVPEEVTISKNTAYCQKAVSLAHMILKDLTLAKDGESSGGESLLIDFDRLFEDFVKKVLMNYSAASGFGYWEKAKPYAFYQEGAHFERSYLPDLLYCYKETGGKPSALMILDMKNKTSQPFQNPDVYQMAFYGQMLNCKKVILCYPASENKSTMVLNFNSRDFFLSRIYGAYINLAGNTAREFKDHINGFIYEVEKII